MSAQLPSQSSLSKILPSFAAIASLGVTVSVAAQLPASAATLIPVNVELSLLVDVSPSISSSDRNNEYALQIEGYRDAFIRLSSEFGSGSFGSVAINLIQWAGENRQEQSIPWTLLNDQASALQFADAIGAVVRPARFSGTDPGSAIRFATPLFRDNDYDGQRWVIDVSGDGLGNRFTSSARDNALTEGVSAINGLPIVTTRSGTSLETWYRNNIQGGAGSFTIAANGFEDVGRALEQKLRRELTSPSTDIPSTAVPEPTTILGILLAGGGLACFKRRQRSV